MGTLIVLAVKLGLLEMGNNTLITCKQMSLLKDQPKGCKNETSVKKPAKNIKSTEMRHTYASLISMALDALKDSKPKTN
jgi:hypothetical protein